MVDNWVAIDGYLGLQNPAGPQLGELDWARALNITYAWNLTQTQESYTIRREIDKFVYAKTLKTVGVQLGGDVNEFFNKDPNFRLGIDMRSVTPEMFHVYDEFIRTDPDRGN